MEASPPGMTAAAYAAQTMGADVNPQEELRKHLDQLAVEADAQSAAERRTLYEDVEALIQVGFLSHQVQVAGVPISMRSLSPGDMFLLQNRVGHVPNIRRWRQWLVSSSIWMVDGLNLLEMPGAISTVHKMVSRLPRRVLDLLSTIAVGLANRVGAAITKTECYCYEPYSRVYWQLCGRQMPGLEVCSGIPGTSRMGMNHVQRMWVAFNQAEDDRDLLLQRWQAAKLVASASSPKGVRKLNQADDRLRKQEESRRRYAIQQMCYRLEWGEAAHEPETMVVMVRGQPVEVPRVKVARTTDELAEQMRMWVAGEKDWHDIVVDTYKERIRTQFAEEKQRREAYIEETQLGVGVSGETVMVGYTVEQLKEYRRDLFVGRRGARQVSDGSAPSVVYQKHIDGERPTDWLQADEHGVYVVPPEPRGSLQEQVASRTPRISTEPIGSPSMKGRRRGPGSDR